MQTANINSINLNGQTNVQMDKSMSKWTNGQESPSILYRGDCPCLVQMVVHMSTFSLSTSFSIKKEKTAW